MSSQRSKELARYLVPSVLSAVSIFLFTIVDGIFVGRGVGSDALGAVNLAFPFIMFFNAFLMLAMVGGLTVTAIRIGRGDRKGAEEVFGLSVMVGFGICLVFTVLGTCFTKQMVRLLGANETYFQLTYDYLFWYCAFLPTCGFCTLLGGFCRNDGAPALVSISTVTATSLNIFGDWLCIYPLQMGLKGAAIATGVAQTVGFLIVLTHFLFKKGSLKPVRPKDAKALLGKILLRGLPECVAQFSVPLSTVLTNIVIIKMLGDADLNAYSVLCYAACFTVAIFLGTSEGAQPLLGRCYGAGNEKDLKYYFRAAMGIGFSGSLVLFFLMWLLWEKICALFGVDGATAAQAVYAYPRYSWGFVVQSVTVIISGYLYSTTRTRSALVINVLRSFVINSAVILLLPMIFGKDSVWYTFGVFEAVCAAIAVILCRKEDRKGIIGNARE